MHRNEEELDLIPIAIGTNLLTTFNPKLTIKT